jgi:Protein of unknown function (DUF4012)
METIPERATADPDAPPPKRRRRWARAAVVVIVIILCLSLLEVVALARMWRGLQHGRTDLAEAKHALVGGDVHASALAFDRAQASFAQASQRGRDPLGSVARLLPWIGNTADAAEALASAGGMVAGSGADLSHTLERMPEGIGSLAPSNGVIPVRRYSSLLEAVRTAEARVTLASEALGQAPDTFTPALVANAVWDAQDQVNSLSRQLTGVASLLGGADGFAGLDAPKRYLVVSQNPAELRGTGGIWGAYSIVTLDGGRVRISRTRPTRELRSFPAGRVPSPNEDYARNYDQWGGAGSWNNLNLTPDFPAAAQAALANYRIGEGQRLDGVVTVDPFAVRDLLAVTGPVTLPNGVRVDARNAVAMMTNRAYRLLPNNAERKELVGAVAAVALDRFLSMGGRGVLRMRQLVDMVAAGHLRLYATDPSIQEGLGVLGADGAVEETPSGEDAFGVIVNSGSGSKVDAFATQTVAYDVQLGDAGDSIANATITIENEAPTTGQPKYVIGPYLEGTSPGDQIPLTSVWCHAPCELAEAARDGATVGLTRATENGLVWFRDYRTIASGDTGMLSVTWRSSGVWEGDASAGRYRLTLFGQTTVRPESVTVTIHAPEGANIVWTNVPMSVDGSSATWSDHPTSNTNLEVRFRAPLLLRVCRDVRVCSG